VSEKQDNQIAEIEATQAALRESIEATKGLAEKAEHLLQQHKQSLRDESGEVRTLS
jgi:ABC-type transporter Mla subunit MlaD